jgi:hypothetical protein
MSDRTHDDLPPEFDVCFERWREADQDVHLALGQYRVAPNAVNHLAVDAAWLALEVALTELEGWALLFGSFRASAASDDASEAWDGLHDEIYRAGLLERWGGP